MADALDWDKHTGRLLVHFDVSDEGLRLATFLETAENAKKIIDVLNENFFEGEYRYEILVLPPQDGSFLAQFKVISIAAGAVFVFLESDIGKAYVEGLTGQEPAYWFKEAGEWQSRELIGDSAAPESHSDAGDLTSIVPEGEHSREVAMNKDARRAAVGADLVCQLTRGIFEKESDQLYRVGMDFGSLNRAMDARSSFYKSCLDDRAVQGLGFSEEDQFPIPRGEFLQRALTRPRTAADESEPPWEVGFEEIIVTSPNWDEKDQFSRQWKGKDSLRRDCFFTIIDKEFWNLVQNRQIQPDVLDKIKVQVAQQFENGKVKKRKVVKVLEYNGTKISDPLDENALRSIFGEIAPVGEAPTRYDLFD